jgi:hypothetical protein
MARRSQGCLSARHRRLGLQGMSSTAEGVGSTSCSHIEKPHAGMASTLSGSCKCGSVSFEAHGPSSFNFTCHCQICRDAVPGSFTTTSVGFKPHQVQWTGKQHLQLMAKASDNYRKALHYECSICRTHMYAAPLLHCRIVTLAHVRGCLLRLRHVHAAGARGA